MQQKQVDYLVCQSCMFITLYQCLVTCFHLCYYGCVHCVETQFVVLRPEKGKGIPAHPGNSTREWYSGWSCMKTLLTKGLVVKSSCPAKYGFFRTLHSLVLFVEKTLCIYLKPVFVSEICKF